MRPVWQLWGCVMLPNLDRYLTETVVTRDCALKFAGQVSGAYGGYAANRASFDRVATRLKIPTLRRRYFTEREAVAIGVMMSPNRKAPKTPGARYLSLASQHVWEKLTFPTIAGLARPVHAQTLRELLTGQSGARRVATGRALAAILGAGLNDALKPLAQLQAANIIGTVSTNEDMPVNEAIALAFAAHGRDPLDPKIRALWELGLDVQGNHDPQAVRRAWLTAQKISHPDRGGDNHESTRLNEWYDLLK
jgi:hypothetical protein